MNKLLVFSIFRPAFFLAVFFGVVVSSVSAQTKAQDKNQPKPIVEPQFLIFPENRLGNALYKDKEWLVSFENCTIKNFLLSMKNTLILWCMDGKGGNFYTLPKEEINKMERVDEKYLIERNQNNAAFYYAGENDLLHQVRLKFKSVTGFLNNNKGLIAMYHVVKSWSGDQPNQTMYQYQVHVYKEKNNQLQSIPKLFISSQSKLNMTWDDQILVVKTESGDAYQFPIKVP